ncbi:hypothetical protein ABZ547_37890 [Streptomyces sparsogenes]|uniref:hypothetical protein n=1 Tax=Streptomyces sparsogenes TaxID=67365 RepID=UPI0033D072C3
MDVPTSEDLGGRDNQPSAPGYSPLPVWPGQSSSALATRRGGGTSAEQTLLLADHTKVSKTATYAYGTVADYHTVITDTGTPESELAAMRDLGVHFLLLGMMAVVGSPMPMSGPSKAQRTGKVSLGVPGSLVGNKGATLSSDRRRTP